MNAVVWPAVQTFPNVVADKEQVVKVLEEAAEVHGAWQRLIDANGRRGLDDLVSECADLIQATSNLLAGVGVYDMRQAMSACHERNLERGRF